MTSGAGRGQVAPCRFPAHELMEFQRHAHLPWRHTGRVNETGAAPPSAIDVPTPTRPIIVLCAMTGSYPGGLTTSIASEVISQTKVSKKTRRRIPQIANSAACTRQPAEYPLSTLRGKATPCCAVGTCATTDTSPGSSCEK